MRKFISFFIKYPIWANAIIIVTALAGVINLLTLNHSFFPELDPNKITITVAYPGASPVEIEEGITTRIEESLIGLEGIKEISSKSKENISSITIETEEKVDINVLAQEVKNAVDGINSFPAGAERPIVVAQKVRGMGNMGSIVSFLSITSDNASIEDLKVKTDEIEKEILALDAISQVEVLGFPPQIISVEIREHDLLKYNLTFSQVSQKIKSQNLDVTAGTIKTNSEELYIRLTNKTTDAEMLKNVVVGADIDGQLIRLMDVADVKFEFSDIALKSFVNGKQNATIIIKKLKSEHLGKISSSLDDYIEDFNKKNDNYQMKVLFSFNDLLGQRIQMLTSNLFYGLILVLVILGIFLSLRLSLWVAFGIPFSMLGMFWLGGLYGISVNMISLFGMILVVGILVDDGIVIAESIYSHYERGKSPVQAALDGTMDVLSSVFTSVLTTIVAFGFLLFVGGEMAMMEEMAFSVVACLAFSLIEVFLILPSHLASKAILAPTDVTWYQNIRNRIERAIERIRNGYHALILKVINRYRWFVWGPMVFIFIVIGLLSTGVIKTAFFPSVPFNDIQVDVAYKPGEREMRTEATMTYLQDMVFAYADSLEKEFGEEIITNITTTIGNAQRVGETGSHAGSLRISVKEQDHMSVVDLSNAINDMIPKDTLATFEKFAVGGDGPFGYDLSLSVQSSDREEIGEAAQWLKEKIKSYPEVKDVVDNAGAGNRELQLELYDKAYALGLDEAQIINQIRQGFFGEEVQRVIIGQDEVKIWARYPLDERDDFGDLDNMKIKTAFGQEFPLYTLADYSVTRGSVTINHINGDQEVRVYGSLYDSELSSTLNAKLAREVFPELKKKFPNSQVIVKGQAEKAADSGKRLGIAFGLGVLLILIILSLNFASFYQARLILMVIPIGIFSALLGHGIVGIPFSMFSFWGVIALVGILVNDAVVMLDQYNKGLKEGLSTKEAVAQAGKFRFRPVILTSLTTVAGLYPLILEKSFQAQFLIPMAVSVAYGVLFGTLFLLAFFPPLILYFNDMRRARFWLWRGGEHPPTRIEVEPVYKIAKRNEEVDGEETVSFFKVEEQTATKAEDDLLDI
ncbi:efflux RND transporter permease subunit [Parvicella tangerina]|uniref:Multidrug resistance protein MexB n=1 Tax=Parvicella tangerina TaxID=2829795 RepID=A0A916JLH1_9FLAO|nr:efflux RND transporter permease subunit [Parvicella tangerina]CAG5080303.1 Multidrug resistance protein MexB [Parvicella tangerina]